MNVALSKNLGCSDVDGVLEDVKLSLNTTVIQKLNFDQEYSSADEYVEEEGTKIEPVHLMLESQPQSHLTDQESPGQLGVQDPSCVSTFSNGDKSSSEHDECSIVDGNLGVLSEFSDRSTESTPLASEILGQLDEIQACMLSLADIGSRQSTNATPSVKSEITTSVDMPLILKRVVDICQPSIAKNNGILDASLRSLASFIASATDVSILMGIIISELNLWLKSIIMLPEYSPYVYASDVEAIISLTECLLVSHYPALEQEGLFALYSRIPVIYMSRHDAAMYSTPILSRLHLPKSVIKVVPYSFSSPNSRTFDIRALDRLISDDMACGKLPLLVISTVGTEVTGHIDNIPAIKHLCDNRGIWLHAKGSCSPLLALSSPPPTASVFGKCDSVTVSCLSTSVLFINNESDHITHKPSLELVLPLWVSLQKIGERSIRDSVSSSYTLAMHLYNCLKEMGNIQILEYPLTGHVVCFRYYSLLDNLQDLSEQEPMNSLMSRLTEIMFDSIEEAVGADKVHLINLSGGLSVIRVSPLITPALLELDVDILLSSIASQVALFETTLGQRETFNREIQSRENFLLVLDPLNASLGAFQYIPKYLRDEELCNSPEGADELNELNEKLCDYLSSSWTVIATRSVAQFSVISVPLISDPLDIAALLNDVVSAAPKFEDNSKYMARMSDIIKRGIDKANEELQQESEQQLYEKGIIRQIPIFGSVYNWMSPIEEKKIVGRSFNLQSGEVQLSESLCNSKAVSPRRSRNSSSSTAG